MIHYVYITTNLLTGKQYVGDHTINKNKQYIGSGTELIKAFGKVGKQNFICEILEWFDTRQEASDRQKYYIKLYKTHISDGGYNVHPSGGTTCYGERTC